MALGNMIIGFWWIFLASCGGFFLAEYRHQAFLAATPERLLQWWMVLQKSAHAHTNLFGMLHILMALTFPYSLVASSVKVGQSVGLFLGSLSMSVLLVVRSYGVPESVFHPLSVLIAMGLSCSLIAIVVHIVGLSLKWYRI